MKNLSAKELQEMSGGNSPFKIIATSIIYAVEFAFDQWKSSRERKHAQYQEYCLLAESQSKK